MARAPAALLLSAALLLGVPAASGEGFLRAQKALEAAEAFGAELQEALGEVMGCGEPIDTVRLAHIERALQPMWRTLPTNSKGRVEWRSLRYLTHRYFMRQSSLMIRGFEPLLAPNASDAGILAKQIPTYVDKMLGGQHADGFSLQDSTYLVATLERVIFDSETHLIEKVYDRLRTAPRSSLSPGQVQSILEAYIVHWMMGEDQDGINVLMKNRTLLETAFPHWENLKGFVGGRVSALNFQRMLHPAAGNGASLLAQQYSFDDAHRVVGGITQTFQSYWESECESMKEGLVEMDTMGTGRVHLSDFYQAGLKDEWRFGESEAYLREMGTLDESAMWHGKQVIIANYLQGASNCIVTTSHYRVCCANPCEDILADIEADIGSSMAPPARIFELIGNMTDADDEPVPVSPALAAQLRRVADQYDGKVPLHGRLFGQWLHYVFPYDCPFPHKSGSVSMASPVEFGDFIAKKKDMRKQVRENKNMGLNETQAESLFMSQWSEEDELFADYSMELQAPWERRPRHLLVGGLVLLAAVALLAGISGAGRKAPVGLELPLSSSACKSHWV